LMKQGRAVHAGEPSEVLEPRILEDVFAVTVLVDANPVTGAPRITPVPKPNHRLDG
jgi:ABC-type hemin transport system ATPase subunit